MTPKKAGTLWAQEYLDSETFQDWVHSNLSGLEGPVSKKEAVRIARNILIDAYYDISRQILPSEYTGSRDPKDNEAFVGAIHDKLMRKNVINWLADEVKYRSEDR